MRPRRFRQAFGLAGAAIAGFSARISVSRSAAPDACAEFAPHLRQRAQRAGGQHRIEQDTGQACPAVMAPGQHIARAEPQHCRRSSRKYRENAEEGQKPCAPASTGAPSVIGLVDGGEKRSVTEAFGGKGLHGARRADLLAGVGRRRPACPAPCASAAHRAAKPTSGTRSREWPRSPAPTASGWSDHHAERAEAQDQIAQRDRHGCADRRLDLRRVGRQAREISSPDCATGRRRTATAVTTCANTSLRTSATTRSPIIMTK
jgi:hypothetical protein